LFVGSSNTLRGGSIGARGGSGCGAVHAGAFAGVGVSVFTGSPSRAESPRPSPRFANSLIAVSVPDPIRCA
jgi:hypothetical protein